MFDRPICSLCNNTSTHTTHTHTSPACNGAAAFCSFHSKGTVESNNDRRDTPSIAHAKTVPGAMADEFEDRLGKTHRDATLNTFCRVFFKPFWLVLNGNQEEHPIILGVPCWKKQHAHFAVVPTLQKDVRGLFPQQGAAASPATTTSADSAGHGQGHLMRSYLFCLFVSLFAGLLACFVCLLALGEAAILEMHAAMPQPVA